MSGPAEGVRDPGLGCRRGGLIVVIDIQKAAVKGFGGCFRYKNYFQEDM